LAAQLPSAGSPPLFKYVFREPLLEGVLQKRKGRFTVEVLVEGRLLLCHCATTSLGLLSDHLENGAVRT
jgi:DNA-binding sugar fermentation-stimulating protein